MKIIKDNIATIRKHLLPEQNYIPVIKSNPYGTGLIKMGQFFQNNMNMPLIAVAQIYEGIQLRENDVNKSEILVMSGVPSASVDAGIQYNLQLNVSNEKIALEVSKAAQKRNIIAKIHIMIETGLNRIGVKYGEELEKLVKYIKFLGNLEINGVFTHFATAGVEGNDYTLEQFELFKSAVKQLKTYGIQPQYIHARNSAASTWLHEDFCTHIRCGALHLGYNGLPNTSNPLGTKEALTWRSYITNIRTIKPGESVGYSRFFKPDKTAKVAIISTGSGDGLFRPLGTSFAPVIVNGIKTRFIGSDMDQFYIDVTDIDCDLDDEVTLFGRDKTTDMVLSPVEGALIVGQARSTMHAYITDRVQRIYLNE